MTEWIANLDQIVTGALQPLAQQGWSASLVVWMQNPWTWTPVFGFLAVLLLQHQQGKEWFSVLFGVAALVIAFQFSTWMSGHIQRLAPFVAAQSTFDLEALVKRGQHPFSMPDWGIALTVACFAYTVILMRKVLSPALKWTFLLMPLLMVIARIATGQCYFSDALTGWTVGLAAAFLLSRFPENYDLLFSPE